MSVSLLQIVLYIYLGSPHPVRYALPKVYYSTQTDECMAAAEVVADKLQKHAKSKTTKIEAVCSATDNRGA